MFQLSATKVNLNVLQRETVTSGAVNVFLVQFSFNSSWDGLDKTAVFRAGNNKISVVLDDSNQCQIPWEVLENPRRVLDVGVYGTKNGTIVLPTIWANIGTIQEGVTTGENEQPPTPDVYSQILDVANEAKEIAQSVRNDADSGKFDGKPGPRGEPGPPGAGVPNIEADDEGKYLGVLNGVPTWMLGGSGSGYEIGHGLKVTGTNTLEVDTATDVEQDNTLPITSAAVYTTVGNIEILLGTI